MEDLDHGQGDEGHGDALGVGDAVREHGELDHAVVVEVHTGEEGRDHQDGDDDALEGDVDAHAAGEDAVGGLTRLALHDVALGLLHAERERGQGVGDEVDPQQLDRLEDGEADKRRLEHREDLGDVGGQQELDDLADVVVDTTAFLHRVDDGGEVIVGKNHVGDVLGDVGRYDGLPPPR